MKKYLQALPIFLLSMMVSLVTFGQDKKVDINIGTEKNDGFFCKPMGMGNRSSGIYSVAGGHTPWW